MKSIMADHSCKIFLKPGEVMFSTHPLLVSTILGSCVAVTMYSQRKGIGAICHAVLPHNLKQDTNLLYVDTAVCYIHRKMMEYGGAADLVVKLFGGGQILAGNNHSNSRPSVGEQNLIQAIATLHHLGLLITKTDIGGTLGRKLFFSIKTGEVYLRKLTFFGNDCPQEGTP